MERYSLNNSAAPQRGRPVSAMDAAHATEYFEAFVNAGSLKSILGYYGMICEHLHLKPNVFPLFYPKIKANITSWKAKALLKKLDARASHKCYGKGKICANNRVLIIGAGPCGLRTAIEAQLLGAKVVVIEKRDRLSRNNVLHLWPFVIEDLRALGAKKFFGKFCAGAIDHISIRQLQCILLKIALLLGVEIHTEVSFEKLLEPTEKTGWRAEFKPENHPVSHYEFDVIIGADGKRNTLQGFKRKEFRGKLAIAITANFINKKTEAEARVEEISGVAFIFNQKFFKELYEETKIDLENIVYYKDDTHYFVMTAKKASLLEKGVIKQDLSDTEKLLAPDNVDREALQEYAKEAANFSTHYQMPDLEFAVNHYCQPDVAMFDFTSMYAAENASKTMDRFGHQLLMILVGDSLLEPFWPTGSGCARGFLSSLDAAWAIRSWASPTTTPLEVMAERESIYRLLAQTTPDNLNKDWKSYTLDPATRYPNLNKNVVTPHQVVSLFDTDNPNSIELMKKNVTETAQVEVPKKRRRGVVDNELLISWIADRIKEHDDITITDLASIFRDGKVLCALIHHYRPDIIDYNAIKNDEPTKNNQLAFDVLEKELGIPPIMTGEEITKTEDYLTMASYLTQVYHTFRGEIPHIKHPKLPPIPDVPPNPPPPKFKTQYQINQEKAKMIAQTIEKSLKKETDLPKTHNEYINTKIPMNQHPIVQDCKTQDSPCSLFESSIGLDTNGPNSIKHNSHSQHGISQDSGFHGLISQMTHELYKASGDHLEIDSSIAIPSTKKKKRVKTKRKAFTYVLYPINEFGSCKSHGNECHLEENKPTDVEVTSNDQDVNEHTNDRQDSNTHDFNKHYCKEHYCNESDLFTRQYNKQDLNARNYNKHVHIKDHCDKQNLNDQVDCTKGIKVSKSTKTSSPAFSNDDLNTEELLRSVDYESTDDLKSVSLNEEGEMFRNSDLMISYAAVGRNKMPSLNLSYKKSDLLVKDSRGETSVSIHLIEKSSPHSVKYRKIHFEPVKNTLTISSKSFDKAKEGAACQKYVKKKFHNKHCQKQKFRLPQNMSDVEQDALLPDQIYSRVSTWISNHDFKVSDDCRRLDLERNTVITDDLTSDITSVTKCINKNKDLYDDIKIEERTNEVHCNESPAPSVENFTEIMKNMSNNKVVRTLSKFSQYSPFKNVNGKGNFKSSPPHSKKFSVIVEGEETELPESNKRSDTTFKTVKLSDYQQAASQRNTSRHKRHADAMSSSKPSIDRKTRKRRTLEKVGASVMFSFFMHAVIESGVVAFLLFIFDVIINSEQYGYQNIMFS